MASRLLKGLRRKFEIDVNGLRCNGIHSDKSLNLGRILQGPGAFRPTWGDCGGLGRCGCRRLARRFTKRTHCPVAGLGDAGVAGCSGVLQNEPNCPGAGALGG